MSEYWVIEPANGIVLRYELREGVFVGLAPRTGADIGIASVVFTDFAITGTQIFG